MNFTIYHKARRSPHKAIPTGFGYQGFQRFYHNGIPPGLGWNSPIAPNPDSVQCMFRKDKVQGHDEACEIVSPVWDGIMVGSVSVS